MKKLIFALFMLCLFASIGWATSKSEDYELQERCSEMAHKRFKENYGKGTIRDNDGSLDMWIQTNHYNKKMNKCFILLHSFHTPHNKTDSFYVYESLFDINEEKEYGDFIERNNDGKPDCKILEKFCYSKFEWESFIKPYMEE